MEDIGGRNRSKRLWWEPIKFMCANPLERVHSFLGPCCHWHGTFLKRPCAPYTMLRVSRCNTAVRPFTSKFMQELDALITLWPLSSWRTSGECATGMQGIAADRQCSMLTVEPNSGHLSSGIFPPYCKYELPSLPRSDHLSRHEISRSYH